jgi:hypothetical protein
MTNESELKVNPQVETKPNELPNIPAGYGALGATTGYDPSSAEDLNFLVIGPSNEGKTTFASSIPDTVIFDYERGAHSIIKPRAVRIPINDIPHFDKVAGKLIDDAKLGHRPFKRVVIDTGDEKAAMLAIYIAHEKNVEDIAEHGREGHGWALLRNRFMSRLRDLANAGYAWTVVGHVIEEKYTNPVTKKESMRIRPAMFPSLYKQILRLVDFEMTCYRISESTKKMKTIEVNNRKIQVPDGNSVDTSEKYYLDMRALDGAPGKKRGVPGMTGRLDLPLVDGWQVFKSNYNRAIDKLKKGESQ